MTIKEKLKSMNSSKEYPEARILDYQDMNFTVFPIDYISIYSTKFTYENKTPLIRVPIYELKEINQNLLDYEFDYFAISSTKFRFTELDLIFILQYNYEDKTKLDMKVKYIN